jgi:hypothetical protein
MTGTAPHVLVVFVDEADVHEFAIECPGVTDACRAWLECVEKHCTARQEHAEDCRADCNRHNDSSEDEPVAHGRRHRYIGGAFVGWGTPSDDCYPVTCGQIVEAAYSIRTDWVRGRYPVEHGLDPNGEYLTLKLLDDQPALSTAAMVAGSVALDRAFSGIGDALNAARKGS